MQTRREEVFLNMFKKSEMKSYQGFKRIVDIPEDKVFKIKNKEGGEEQMKLIDIYEFLLGETKGGMFTTILEQTLKDMGFKNDLMYVRNELMEAVFKMVDDARENK